MKSNFGIRIIKTQHLIAKRNSLFALDLRMYIFPKITKFPVRKTTNLQ